MFNLGEVFTANDKASLEEKLELLINHFDDKIPTYQENFTKASELFSPANFARRLVEIITGEKEHKQEAELDDN